jgi:hypothetical protein
MAKPAHCARCGQPADFLVPYVNEGLCCYQPRTADEAEGYRRTLWDMRRIARSHPWHDIGLRDQLLADLEARAPERDEQVAMRETNKLERAFRLPTKRRPAP